MHTVGSNIYKLHSSFPPPSSFTFCQVLCQVACYSLKFLMRLASIIFALPTCCWPGGRKFSGRGVGCPPLKTLARFDNTKFSEYNSGQAWLYWIFWVQGGTVITAGVSHPPPFTMGHTIFIKTNFRTLKILLYFNCFYWYWDYQKL